MRISIITPTYNRRGLLERLFESLVAQQYNNLEWIVVDDGGQDKSSEVVLACRERASFDVSYIRQENAGKHVAVNRGLSMATGDLVALVDDDDYVLPDILQGVAKDFEEIRGDDRICGLSYLCVDPVNHVIGRPFPKDDFVSNHIECRINRGVWGDKVEFLRLEIGRRYRIPAVQGERFFSETITWVAIAKQYETRYINRPVLVKNYLPDGLSVNWSKLRVSSPRGMTLYYRTYLDKAIKPRIRMKYMIALIAHMRVLKQNPVDLLQDFPEDRGLFLMCYLPGLFCGAKWKRELGSC